MSDETTDPDTVTIPSWLYDQLVRDAAAYRAMQPNPWPMGNPPYWWRVPPVSSWMTVTRKRI